MKAARRKHVSSSPLRAACLQRHGAGGFGLVLLAGLAVCGLLFVHHIHLSEAATLSPLADRINPNTAPMGSLIRLEGIGPARAYDVIQYRQQRLSAGERAFQSPQDLEAIRGIGPKTVEKMAPQLIFE